MSRPSLSRRPRRGAGRKPSGPRAGASHDARDPVGPNRPVHVTLRVADHVWNLRIEHSFRVIHAAVRGSQRKQAFRVVHFSIQGNHLHGIMEADGDRSFESGMRALTIRLSKGLNKMMA